ncbi:MAG TPA: preprotein translocase subunit YajC [Gemmatimonadales bacterium]
MTLPTLFLLLAPSGQAGGRGLGIILFQAAAFIAIIYFLLIRPKVQQEKRHREQIAQVKRGDEIVTAGGIVGEVVHIKDDRLTLKTGESRIVVLRDRIAEVRPAGAGEPAGR